MIYILIISLIIIASIIFYSIRECRYAKKLEEEINRNFKNVKHFRL